jgi:hypothetical protein
VSVRKLPQSEYSILNDAEYITNIKQNETTSIFACIDDGLRSTAYLSAVLPTLEVNKQLKNADVQVYCYFNFPEERDNSFIEESINKIAKTIPIFYFGNFAEELTEEAIKNQEQDELAKLINFMYYMNYQYHQKKAIQRLDEIIDGSISVTADTLKKKLDEIGEISSKEDNSIFRNECLNLAWNSLDEFKKESNRIAADHVFVKLRHLSIYIGFGNPNQNSSDIWEEIKASKTSFKLREGLLYTLSELEHRRWCAERLFYGWDYFHDSIPSKAEWGKLKEEVYEPLKIHVDMLPFVAIHKDEQRIDMVLIENLGLIFKMLGEYETYNINQNI